MQLAPGLHPSARAELGHAWLAFLAGRGLYCAGGGGAERLAYAVGSEASQATEGDRRAAKAWLASRVELQGWQVGDLDDLDRAV